MGEVVDDVESKSYWRRWKYKIFFCFVWMTAIAGALIVIINCLKIIVDLIIDLASACRFLY